MRFPFPNPEEFLHREDLFFDQLELAIYHARKSWDKIKRQYSPDDEDSYPWLSFHNALFEDERILKAIEELHSDDYEARQHVSIEINEL